MTLEKNLYCKNRSVQLKSLKSPPRRIEGSFQHTQKRKNGSWRTTWDGFSRKRTRRRRKRMNYDPIPWLTAKKGGREGVKKTSRF